MEAWPQEHTKTNITTKAAERVHGILASQIATHSIFSLLHILHSPDTQDHISSFPTALAKLYYLSWHIDWLVQNAVSRHVLTVFCYRTCQIVCILWTPSSYEPSADLVTQFQLFVCLCACVCSLEFIVNWWLGQCNVQKRHILHTTHNACNKVYCILQHIINSKTSSLSNFKKDIVQAE